MTPVDQQAPGQGVREPGSAALPEQCLRIHLLGGFRISVGSRTLEERDWRLRKGATLVKLLALAPGHRVHREQIVDVLWPDLDLKAADNNLHHTLHVARRILRGDEPDAAVALQLRAGTLTLHAPDGIWTDVNAFEAAASAARRTGSPDAYRAALALYGGDLLPEDLYEDWAASRRAALHDLYIALLLELARLDEEAGELGQAIDTLQRAVRAEPALEEAHVELMRVYAKIGQRQQALRQYEQLQHALADELDAEPDTASQALYQEILEGRLPAAVTSAVAAQPSPAPAHNLPAHLSSFIGREGVIADLRQRATQSRLLTLIGAGGVGKTRLAGVLGRQMLHEYPDGVWLVELASLSRGTQIPRAIAGALSLKEQSGEPLTATIHAALERKRLLLVLDNCEHLIGDCARLAEALLRSCPQARILATSREPLCIAGEATFVVPPLSLPDTHRLPPLDALGELEAVQLFVERARLRQSGFALREENAAAIAQICRQVHGLPLAIELAAARVGLLSVDQIAARLSDAPSFLTGGSRTAEPRQQTLRGALDWSYALLSEPERRLLQRLSVFAGGWSLEAAEIVGAEGSNADDSILELLSRLVDKSLVVVEVRPDAAIRYSMLEPIRQYAWEHLVASGEAERLERRHAALFAALADQAQIELSGASQVRWLDRLDKERDNIRVALRRSISHGEPEVGLRIASGIWRFWFSRGYTSEGRAWLAELFSLPGSDTVAPDIRAKGVHAAGALAYYQGDYTEALERYEAALAVRRRMDDRPAIGRLLGNMGLVVKEQGNYDRATALYEEALALSREIGDKRGLSANLNNLAIVLQDQGEYERAARMHEESLALSQQLGETYAVMYSLNNLAAVALEQGQFNRAIDYGEKALRLAREIGNVRSTIVALANLGLVAQEQGEFRCAWARYDEAVRLVQPIADKQQTFTCLEYLAHLARAEGQYRRAATLCGAAARIRERSGSPLERADRPRVEATTSAAREALGDAGFEAAWLEGQELTMEEALEYALTREPAAHDAPLTRREREIAGAIARGLTNRQIATELHIAERTVDTHVQHILSKLGISSRTKIPTWAFKETVRTGLSQGG